jgi:hypothetical protein
MVEMEKVHLLQAHPLPVQAAEALEDGVVLLPVMVAQGVMVVVVMVQQVQVIRVREELVMLILVAVVEALVVEHLLIVIMEAPGVLVLYI